MIRAFSLLAAFSCFGFLADRQANGFADVVWMKSGEQRCGVILSETSAGVLLADRLETPEQTTELIPWSEIDDRLRTIDIERVIRLEPNSPYAYLELADELARFPRDRVANQLMKRLYFLCLFLGDEAIQKSAELALRSALEPSERDSLAPWLNSRGLSRRDQSADEPFIATRTDITDLQKLIRAIRSEAWEDAKSLMTNTRVQATLEHWSSIICWTELEGIVQRQQLSEQSLLKLLGLSERLNDVVVPMSVIFDSATWYASGSSRVAWPPSLTEFIEKSGIDPRQTIFRDGVWIAPRKKTHSQE